MGLFGRLFKRGEQVRCAKCGRVWKVPTKVDKRPRVFVSVPRPDLPAGECPRCGSIYCQRCSPSKPPPPSAGFYHCPKCGVRLDVTPKVSSILVTHSK